MRKDCDNVDRGNLLRTRQGYALHAKVALSKIRIREWYEHWGGLVYVAFSGGKDSTVLLDLVRSIYPEVPAVFVDTGLEYPEIKEFVRSVDNVTWLKPKMSYRQVIDKYGYPVVSKKNARFIRDLQNKTNKNFATRNLRLTGYNRKGEYLPSMILPKKWRFLVDAPFKVSEQCCDVMKKEPFSRYVKETNRKSFSGVMASDSNRRNQLAKMFGCNMFDSKIPISRPMLFWLEDNIWEYIKANNIQYSKIYDMGESRTGCMWCMFGVHLEKNPNRFQRMKNTHPKIYNYCINKMELGKVLDTIGVEYG